MRRRNLPFAMGLLLAAAACGPAQVVVTIEQTANNPDGSGTMTQPLTGLEVQILPYDRDQVFDSLQKAFGTPEPEIPQDLLDARDQVRQAQEKWQSATARWNTLRDTLQKINEAIKKYSRGEAQYVVMYKDFEAFDAERARVEKEMNASFKEFDSLQKGTIHESDSVRIARENWADEAFADVDPVITAKVRAAGLPVVVDTTDANGVASGDQFKVPPGKYWVYARYELPYTELYWNVPIEVKRGDPNEIKLNRDNAKERIKL
jgi:hypothetical protein